MSNRDASCAVRGAWCPACGGYFPNLILKEEVCDAGNQFLAAGHLKDQLSLVTSRRYAKVALDLLGSHGVISGRDPDHIPTHQILEALRRV